MNRLFLLQFMLLPLLQMDLVLLIGERRFGDFLAVECRNLVLVALIRLRKLGIFLPHRRIALPFGDAFFEVRKQP